MIIKETQEQTWRVLQKMGLTPASQMQKGKFRRLMLGTEGLTNTGKTEFLLSAPGPKVIIPIDSSYDSALDNPYPPASRKLDDAYFDDTSIVPNVAQVATAQEYVDHFKKLRGRTYTFCDSPDIRTICIDGDSDFYELQLLAEFGRLSQIHPLSYPMVDGMRRWITKKWWDSGKIIIGTNKVKDKYVNVLDSNGDPIKDDKNKNVQEKVEGEYKRQGFRDQTYLWQIQIRHLYKPGEPIDLTALKPVDRLRAIREGKTKTLPEWGLRILKCKPNTRLEGDELWGEDCCFAGLVQYVYPQTNLSEWGF